MRAGRLKHRVTIQQSALAAADTYGDQAETWSDVTTVWAEVRTLDAVESWKAKQSQPEATVQVVMRYTADMNSAARLLFGTRYLYPLSVVENIDKTELRILCKEKL